MWVDPQDGVLPQPPLLRDADPPPSVGPGVETIYALKTASYTVTGPLVIGPVSPRHNPVSTVRCVSSHATRGRSR